MIFLAIFGFGAWYGSNLLGSINKVFHGNLFSDAQALFSTTKLKGEDQGRVNILLAGDSADDPGHGGADLTDSIMVVSIDTKNNTGFMLSIPRDLWVYIPGWSHQKINAANDVKTFDQPGYPTGGMGQLQQIVQTDLGIPIDYYALINYAAFKDAVNTVGGISIDIKSTDPRGLYDAYTNLKLPNGWVTLSGQEALDLARARGDNAAGDISYGFSNSDYNRTQHQREMLVALAQKAESAGVITNPIKVAQLFNAFSNNIQTNLTLQDALRLIQIIRSMKAVNMKSLVLSDTGSNSLLINYATPDGEEALIPRAGVDNFGAVRQYYQQLTSNNPVVKEDPSVVVLNGTNVVGLAHKEAKLLQTNGFDVLGVSDANGDYQNSMIVDLTNGQKPASLQLLKSTFSGSSVTTGPTGSTEADEAQGYNADFVVILGQNL